MEPVMGIWQKIKSNKHPKLAVLGALCHNALNKTGLKVPNRAREEQTTMFTAMPDTGVSMFLIGRCVTMPMGITKHHLAKTS